MTNDVRVWLYPGANPQSDPALWESSFVDISAKIRRPGQDGGAPITYSGGKQDESTVTDAGQMSLTLDNRDGQFSTDKIDGPYYGLIDTNTPIRLGVTILTDPFTRTVANGWGTVNAALSQSWSVSGTASNWSVDGSKAQVIVPAVGSFIAAISNANSRDVDIVSSFTPSATATGSSYGAGHVVRYTNSSNLVYTTVEFNTAGTVTVKIRHWVAGVSTELAALNPIPASTYTPGVAWKLRTQADGDAIRVKAWPAAGSQPTTWQATTTEGTNAGTGVGFYVVRFGSNTNSGVVSLVAMDDYTAIGLEWTGYVVSWPLRWDMTGNNSWAPITASGILYRLRQGTNPVQSPLRRQLTGTPDATGYWPMEEGSDSKYFLNTVAGTGPATFSGVTPAQDNTLAGGGPAPTITSVGGTIRAQVRLPNNGTGMSTMFFVKLPSIPATKTRIARIRCSRGPVPIYDLSIDTGATYIDLIDSSLNIIATISNAPAEDFTQWTAWQIETDTTLSPGDTVISAIYHSVGKAIYWAQTGTFIGGVLNTNVLSTQLTGDVGTAFAHLWMGRNTLPFVTDTFSLVSSGYATELAADRFARVCGEAGIPFSIAGDNLASEPMGAQKEATTMGILQSCADTDFGVIAERGSGLEFIGRTARWNLTQIVAVSVAARQISEVPQPTRDGQRLRNKWTISRTGGSSGTYQDDASVARNGTWEDSATINSFDDSVLENHAAWRVNFGIGKRLRWPSVSFNFARSPELMAAWRQRTYGWRLGITTALLQVTGNEPDLNVEGFQAVLTPEVWTVDMNCTDAKVWSAAVTDDTGIYGRVDVDTGQCTTTALINASTLSIPITTAAGYPKWDNTAGLWSGGVDFNVGGERVTVTSITNGAGQAQTLNATVRGVGGYAASHASGSVVSLWFPAPVAL
jgi:hypothetical protein